MLELFSKIKRVSAKRFFQIVARPPNRLGDKGNHADDGMQGPGGEGIIDGGCFSDRESMGSLPSALYDALLPRDGKGGVIFSSPCQDVQFH